MTENNDHVPLIRRIPQVNEHDFGTRVIPPTERLFTRPTLLCCGGIDTNIYSEAGMKSASGYAKAGANLLGVACRLKGDEPYDIVSMVYPDSERNLYQHLTTYTQDTLSGKNSEVIPSARSFAEQHLFPLIQDEQGHALPIEQTQKNLRNVNVLAHSYGGAFIQQVGNALVERMEHLGFTPKQIKDTTSQVLVVAVGSGILPASGRANFTSVDVASYSDTKMSAHYDRPRQFKQIMGDALDMADRIHPQSSRLRRSNTGRDLFHFPSTPLTVLPVNFVVENKKPYLVPEQGSNHVVIYAGPKVAEHGELTDMPIAIAPMHRSDVSGKFGKLETETSDPQNHDTTNYFTYGAGRHGLMLRTAIASAISNGMSNALDNATQTHFIPLPSTANLLQAPANNRFQHNEIADYTKVAKGCDYNDRIREAFWQAPPPRQSRGL